MKLKKKIFKQNLYIGITLIPHKASYPPRHFRKQLAIEHSGLKQTKTEAYLNYELSILQLLNASHLDKIRDIVLYRVGKRLIFSMLVISNLFSIFIKGVFGNPFLGGRGFPFPSHKESYSLRSTRENILEGF